MQQAHSENEFTGPVFIVGMARSGTKLMRALLNQHPQISITLAESKFIPYFIKKFGDPPPFKNEKFVHSFINEFTKTTFYRVMKDTGYNLDKNEFIHFVDHSSWSAIFEHILVSFGPKRGIKDMIWGDKTPAYVNHMPLLKHLFPKAKFIHMIRDPRDYCPSVRKSFGMHIYSAAQRWKETMNQAHSYGSYIHNDYIEVYYEKILEDPENTMKNICTFLTRKYSDKMVQLESSHEQRGDTRGKNGIVRNNFKKYQTQFSKKEITRIEEIVCQTAISMSYVLENNVVPKPLSSLNLTALKMHDGFVRLLKKGLFDKVYTKKMTSLQE
jgi:hypothetical protein